MSEITAIEYVTAIVRDSGTSFYWGMRLLPRQRRDAMYAVYAFCREVDDIADEGGDPDSKLKQLAEWRAEIDRIFAGTPSTLIGEALKSPVQEFGLKADDFNAVIDGMETDAAESVRLKTMDDLDLYCDRVACAVGRLSNPVFGAPEGSADLVALRLGQALQLTNILRDVDEDAAIDRLYIPADMLQQHDIQTVTPSEVVSHPNFPQLCEELADLAENRFRQAEDALSSCDRRTMRPANLMLQNYKRVLARLRRRGWQPPREPVVLGKLEKLRILLCYAVR